MFCGSRSAILMEHLQSFLALAGARVGIGYYEILRASVSNQTLGRIEISQLLGDRRIARLEFFNLPVHRDGL